MFLLHTTIDVVAMFYLHFTTQVCTVLHMTVLYIISLTVCYLMYVSGCGSKVMGEYEVCLLKTIWLRGNSDGSLSGWEEVVYCCSINVSFAFHYTNMQQHVLHMIVFWYVISSRHGSEVMGCAGNAFATWEVAIVMDHCWTLVYSLHSCFIMAMWILIESLVQ